VAEGVSMYLGVAERGVAAEIAILLLGFLCFGRQSVYAARCSVSVPSLLRGGSGATSQP